MDPPLFQTGLLLRRVNSELCTIKYQDRHTSRSRSGSRSRSRSRSGSRSGSRKRNLLVVAIVTGPCLSSLEPP